MTGKSKLYEAYEQNEDAAEAGLWVTDLMVPVPIKLRSLYCVTVRRLQNTLNKKYQIAARANGGTLAPEALDRRTVELLAKGVVANWGVAAARAEGHTLPPEAEEMTDREGNVLPFSVEHAMTVFRDLPMLREEVLGIAMANETFRKAALEDLAGNSSAPSAPSSSSAGPA